MKIYDHWGKAGQRAVSNDGSKYWLVGWAGSNLSVADAQKEANNRIEALKDKLSSKGWLRNSYSYDSDHPIKEMVIDRFGDTDNPYAAITRNRYGALVLNAARVFIADVDLPQSLDTPSEVTMPEWTDKRKKSDKKVGFLKILFGGGANDDEAKKHNKEGIERDNRLISERTEITARREKLVSEQRDSALSKFAEFHRQFPELSFLVYATAAGYRVVITNQTVKPDSTESENWMEALNSDKLYRKLCQKQQCYRARLTPKPWRLPGCKSTVFFPNGQASEEYQLEKWLKTYEEKSVAYAVCELIETYGDGIVVDEVAEVMRIHDRYVMDGTTKPLA